MRLSTKSTLMTAVVLVWVACCVPLHGQPSVPQPGPVFAKVLTASALLRARLPAQRLGAANKSTLSTPYERYLLPNRQKILRRAKDGGLPQPLIEVTTKGVNGSKAEGSDAATASASFGAFYGNRQFVTQSGAGITVTGDFNHDGNVDVAVLPNLPGAISVLLNDGSGSFGPPVASSMASTGGQPTIQLPVSAQAIDINGDGYDDLVVSDIFPDYLGITGPSLFVYMNTGDGSGRFQPAVPYEVESKVAGGFVASFTVADTNGDGHPDLVVVSYSPADAYSTIAVQTLFNDGSGTFETSNIAETDVTVQNYAFPPFGGVLFKTVAGRPTLMIESYALLYQSGAFVGDETDVLVLPSNGDGTFEGGALRTVHFPALFTGVDLEASFQVGDLNNDGNADIVLGSGDGGLWVSMGAADGSYAAPTQVIADIPVYTEQLELADVNGDGYLDLIEVEAEGTNFFTGYGDGTFVLAGSYDTGYSYDSTWNWGVLNLAVADFNKDGRPDLAVQDSFYPTLNLLADNGDGSFAGTPKLTQLSAPVASQRNLVASAVFDMNGDGKADILAVNTANGAVVESGISDGKGNFTYQPALPPDSYDGLLFIEPVTGDFNRDGLQDIVFVTSTTASHYQVWSALSNGDGTFKAPTQIDLSSHPPTTEPGYLAVGDVNNDGVPDVVFAYLGDAVLSLSGLDPGTSGAYVALGKGDGSFAPGALHPDASMANFSDWYLPVLADLDGDGNLDLILASANYGIHILPGDGTGKFAAEPTQTTTDAAVNLFVSDTNLDGVPDLVVNSYGSCETLDDGSTLCGPSSLEVYLGNSEGSLDPANAYAVGISFSSAAVADFNGDGTPDILLADGGFAEDGAWSGVSFLLGRGDGTFSHIAAAYDGFPESSQAFTGDFLGDGTQSAVVVEGAGGGFAGSMLLVNQGGTALTLQAAQTSLYLGASPTLTATVTPDFARNTALPTGEVTLFDNGVQVDQEQIQNGAAVFQPASPAAGGHVYTVSYGGDAHHNRNLKSASVGVNVVAVPPTIAVTYASNNLVLVAGQTGFIAITVTGNASYNGNILFSCTGLPQDVGCTFTPGSVAVGPQQTVTEVLGVTTSATAQAQARPDSQTLPATTAWISLPALLLLGFAGRRRHGPSRLWTLLPGCFFAALAVGSLASCGGAAKSTKAVAQTRAIITVTATPSVVGVAAQTATVNLTIN